MIARATEPVSAQREVPSRATFVFVASARSNEIRVFALDAATGKLEQTSALPIPPGVTPLALDPRGRFLYAGFRSDGPAVVAFAIDPSSGRLERCGGAALDDPPMYLATDQTGAFMLSASYAGAAFAVNAVDPAGRIESPSIQRSATPPFAHGIRTDPSNRFLFVTSLGGDAILQYEFEARTGRATPNDVPLVRTPDGCGPRHLAFHPSEPVLYVNGELDGTVRSFALDRITGRLEPLATASMMPDGDAAPWAAELAVRSDGRYLYASERRTSTLAIFDLGGPPGALRRCATVAVEDQPRSLALGSDGRWLVVAGELSNQLTLYAIDASTGALDPLQRCAAGDKPVWVVFADVPVRAERQ
jgi:6-phosphogluconolactonase